MEPCDDCEIETLAEHGIVATQDVRGLSIDREDFGQR